MLSRYRVILFLVGLFCAPNLLHAQGDAADVGRIELREGFSPTGARTYDIPITTVPGLRPSPSISLHYDSQADNCSAGYGWSVAGIPCISLADRTAYFEGFPWPGRASDDSTAVYRLDGVPLLPNIGALREEYSLRAFSGNILAKQNTSNFEVLYPDGARALFGLDGSGFHSAEYPLGHLEDKDGNALSVSYFVDGDKYYLSNITYGQNSNGHIRFNYAIRPDALRQYRSGKEYPNRYILKEILSLNDADTLACLSLTHTVIDSVSVLCSVRCYNSEGSLPELTFTYGTSSSDGSPVFEPSYQSYLPIDFPDTTKKIECLRGKLVQGDASDGVLIYPWAPNYTVTASSGLIFNQHHRYGSAYASNQKILVAPSLGGFPSMYDDDITAGEGFQDIACVDVNGDGVDEIVKVNNVGISSDDKTIVEVNIYRCYSSNISHYHTFRVRLSGTITEGSYKSPYYRFYRYGDFLGNGKIQLMAFSCADNGFGREQYGGIALIDLSQGCLLAESYPFEVSSEHQDRVITLDLDGDSRMELYHVTPRGFIEYVANSDGTFSRRKIIDGLTEDELLSEQKKFAIADINGDGYCDFLVSPSYESTSCQWEAHYYNGDDRFTKRSFPIAEYNQHDKIFLSDIDKDGLADLVLFSGNQTKSYLNQRGIIQSRGTAQSVDSTDSEPVPCRSAYQGESCEFIVHNRFSIVGFKFRRDARKNRLLTGVYDGIGLYYENAYSDLESQDGCVLGATALSPSFFRERFPLMLLTYSNHSMAGAAALDPIRISYEGPVLNHQGLGFCGFEKMKIFHENSRLTETNVHDPLHFGVILSQQAAFGGETPHKSATFEYDFPSMQLPRLLRTEITDSVEQLTSTVTYSYDSLDFVTREVVVNTRNGIEGVKQARSIAYCHSLRPELYVLGNILTDKVSHSKSSSFTPRLSLYSYTDWASYEVVDSCTYDEGMHLASKIKKGGEKHLYIRDPLLPPTPIDSLMPLRSASFPTFDEPQSFDLTRTPLEERHFEYDGYGNITRERFSSQGCEGILSISKQWSSDGASLLSQSDVLGLSTTYGSRDKWGNPLSITDNRGNITHYEYDPWGRCIGIRYPDGSFEANEFSWEQNGWSQLKTSSGEPPVRTFYDALGRETLRKELRFDGRELCCKTEYDSRGRVSRISSPYFGETPTSWNERVYDDFGRLTIEKHPDDSADSLFYNGAEVTTIVDGVRSMRTMDPDDRLTAVTDPGGEIRYNYDICGRLTSVSAPGPATSYFRYDRYGNRSSINDPAAGVQTDTTRYLPSGETIVITTNQNGRSQTLTDKFGRLALSIVGADTTVINYSQDGLLRSERCSNGMATEYSYDSFDRLYNKRQLLSDDRWFLQDYSYDSLGRLASIRYRSSQGLDAVESYAYSNGTLSQICLGDTTVLWSLIAEDAQGFPVRETLGPLDREYSYDLRGRTCLERTSALRETIYSYDPLTGNMLSRGAENFSYDGLNRLCSGASYDSYGNITNLEDQAQMSYHAYTLIGVTPEGISSFGRVRTSYRPDGLPRQISSQQATATLEYGPSCKKMSVGDSLVVYYADDCYELSSPGQERLYLAGGSAVLLNGTELRHIVKDHLGSVELITDSQGNVLGEYSYDPWGKSSGEDPLLGRGFAGYEYLPWFGIYNAGSRLYDPMLGRFLSPDPFVGDPLSSVALNRYLYCLNNPLRYRDPNGEFVFTTTMILGVAAGVVIGSVLGVLQSSIIAYTKGLEGKERTHVLAMGGLVGGLAGGLGILSGGLVEAALPFSGFLGGAIVGATTGTTMGMVNGFGMTYLATGNTKESFKQMGWQALGGLINGAILGGLNQGLRDLNHGGSFWTGNGRHQQISVTNQVNSISERDYSVYRGIDPGTNEVKYIGITKRDPQARWAEHLRSGTNRSLLRYEKIPGLQGLSRQDARIYEQMLINKYGLANLYNKINSISPKYWPIYGITE